MKKVLTLFLGLLGLVSLAQDRVVMRDNTILSGVVKSVDLTSCLLQRMPADTLIPMNTIKRIMYANGLVDQVSMRYSPPAKVKGAGNRNEVEPALADESGLSTTRKYRKNYFHAGVGNFFLGELSLGVEHLIDNGKFGVRVPLKIGFGEFDDFYNDMIGVDFMLYPGRQGTVRFFWGLGYRMGNVSRPYSIQVSSGGSLLGGSSTRSETRSEPVAFRGPMVTAGLFLRPLNWLGINASVGVGSATLEGVVDPSSDFKDRQKDRRPFPDLQLNLVIGI
ncbi:MAG TPA: hypothetical protein VFV37_02645 [Luteibaculaceae bacterium]|nr:hypothetical protein [Luteibaculaceae bacterium]